MQIKTIQTNGFTMDVLQFGEGKQPFVILPGVSIQDLMLSKEAIVESYQPIADHYDVYLLCGRKELPETYSIMDATEDILSVIHQLGLQHIILYGVSYGGMIAQAIAIQKNDLVDYLLLSSTSPSVVGDQYTIFNKWSKLARTKDAEQLYVAFAKDVYPKEVYEQSTQLLEDSASQVTENDLEHFATIVEGFNTFDVRDQLEKITCPVLLIYATDDTVFGDRGMPVIAKCLEGRDDVIWKQYEGYGHAVYDLAPDLKECILEFLQAYQTKK